MHSFKLNDLHALITVVLTSIVISILKFKEVINIDYNIIILGNILYIFIYIIVSLNDIKNSLSKENDSIIEGEVLNAQEFYKKLRKSVSKAKSSIDLMQMSDSKPDEMSGVEEIQDYYEKITRIIKRNDSITIRRIVSIASETKFDWVCETIKRFKDKKNFSLRYMRHNFNKNKTPYPLNVQIIDGKEVFIINPKQGYMEPTGKSNLNIRIKSPTIGRVLSEYYDNYFYNCEKIYEVGDPDKKKLKEIMEQLGINKKIDI